MLCGVIRHTERADEGFGLVDGSFWLNSPDNLAWPYDPPLSDDAVDKAREAAQRIAKFAQQHESTFHVVVTSPYKRCIQTALEITKALGDGTSMLVDRSLGEVFNSDSMGSVEKPRTVVRPVEGWQAAWDGEVDCMHQAINTWPPWDETVDEARFRYADGFLSYLRRAADTGTNFLLVTHMEGVAASLSMMPFSANKCVTSVGFGGMFLAKASANVQSEITRGSRNSSDACGVVPSCGWEVKTYNVKTRRVSGRNSMLKKALESSSMDVDDVKALVATGVRWSSRSNPQSGESAASQCDESSPGDEMWRQDSPGLQVFARKASSGSISTVKRSPSKESSASYDSPNMCSAKLLQREWCSERSIVLCHGRQQGCPIFHASEGFLKLFGLTANECLGVQCGQLTRPDPLLEALVWPSRLHIRQVVQDLLHDCAQTGFALLLNRKRSGSLFVNELVMRTHRCPMTGTPYIIGMQADASPEVSILKFMECCTSPQAYAKLLAGHQETLLKRVSYLALDCDSVLNEIFNLTYFALRGDSPTEALSSDDDRSSSSFQHPSLDSLPGLQ